MNNILNFKSFINEAYVRNDIYLPTTSKEALTTYYKCNKCSSLYKTFNEESVGCKICGSNDIKNISDFKYFAELKKTLDKEKYNKEIENKNKRENIMVDLIGLGDYNRIRNMKRNIN